MRIKERQTVTKEYDKEIAIVCDLCGEQYPIGWKAHPQQFVSTVVELMEGVFRPEGTLWEKISVDICPSCFRKCLVPWLRTQGAVVETILGDDKKENENGGK